MKTKYSFIFYLLAFFIIFSCIPTKEISYLGEEKEIITDRYGYISSDSELYRLQPDDILSVQIISKDPDLASLFGAQLVNHSNVSQVNEGDFYINGLTIKNNGAISIPIIGEVFIGGLSLEEARKTIKKTLYALYKKEAVFVKVQLSGINYSIIGEVNRPGRYEVYKNRLSILDAIAQAGDLTITAERKFIKLIRQYGKGKKVILVDLTKASILNSPYYYLQPHDILVINPKRQKSWGIGTNTIGTIATILGTAASIFGIVLSARALSKN